MHLFEKFDISEEDLVTIPVSKEYLNWQLELFDTGIPAIELTSPATYNNGIRQLSEELSETENLLFEEAKKSGRISSFIPASGAASRMFKKLEVFVAEHKDIDLTSLREIAGSGNKDAKYVLDFVENINSFAFFPTLKQTLKAKGIDADNIVKSGEVRELVCRVISDSGLGLSNMPKGVIEFHKKDSDKLTPLHEHVYEASEYMTDASGNLNMHFTVSPEHRVMFRNLYQVIKNSEQMKDINLDMSFSIQKKGTDTIALDMDKKALRDEQRNIMFRPGGHGALLENLNDLRADIVVIKNVDNVSPDELKKLNINYKKLLITKLLKFEQKIFHYLEQIHEPNVDKNLLDEIHQFCVDELEIRNNDYSDNLSHPEKVLYYTRLLNRPLRVCGMVKNEGDPGGGPFWVKEQNGESLQIVEASQINTSDPAQKEIMENSTHFNPVELVCSLRNFRGKNFNLLEFRDKNTAFISKKSKMGKELYALELPGLWNGAMAKWNTLFFEIPKATFNPVKEVNDLLKPSHRY